MHGWTDTFEQGARTAGSARARVTHFAASGPLGAIVSLLLGLVALALLIVLIVPIVVLAIAGGILAFLYFKIRAAFARIGSPNSRVGPVRTDGRSNVRVVRRDDHTR